MKRREHAIGVERVGLLKVRATCVCGWRGPEQSSEYAAEQDKHAHKDNVIREEARTTKH